MATRQLAMALYAEGRTDERFLPIIIERTAVKILAPQEIDILPITILRAGVKRTVKQPERILDVARQAHGLDVLLVHTDADSVAREDAKRQRIDPGFDLVRRQGSGVCKHLIPVIPVQEMEAWMLADLLALQRVLHTNLSPDQLGIPTHATQIEAVARPKEMLEQAIEIAWGGRPRRRRFTIADIHLELARSINLERLAQMPSYRCLTQDLRDILQTIGMI
ncbi:MAG TPA: DUF4276 family protein [Chloroflexia bacterium]|nr:DUF4276 family protein [Chloroflexia bacterium]